MTKERSKCGLLLPIILVINLSKRLKGCFNSYHYYLPTNLSFHVNIMPFLCNHDSLISLMCFNLWKQTMYKYKMTLEETTLQAFVLHFE